MTLPAAKKSGFLPRDGQKSSVRFQFIEKMGALSVFLGSVVYLHILGQGLVFLNTHEAVYDLMEKRSDIYSDKPQLVLSFENFWRNSDPLFVVGNGWRIVSGFSSYLVVLELKPVAGVAAKIW